MVVERGLLGSSWVGGRLAVHGYTGVGGGTRQQQQQHAYTTLEEAEIRLKITVGRRNFVTYYLGIGG